MSFPYEFPQGFVFGGATAAYQCEGHTHGYGKGEVGWDAFLAHKGFSANSASDFYHRYEEDLALCERFGIGAIRISIAWSRIFSRGTGEVNPEGVAFYHRLFQACHAHGVEPYVTLHHFDTPRVLFEQGDFLNRATIDAFEAYARFCFEEYCEEVHNWFTFNEIWAVAANTYIEGTFPPGTTTGRIDLALQCSHNMMLAHARAALVFRAGGFPGKIGIVHALEGKYPFNEQDPRDIEAARREDILQNQYLLDATFRGDYAPDTLMCAMALAAMCGGKLDIRDNDLQVMRAAARQIDYLGVNYYQSRFLRAYDGPNILHHNGTGERGSERYALRGVGERVAKEGIPRTDWDWLIYPGGLYDLLVRIRLQYPNYRQILITENGMGAKDVLAGGMVDDSYRIDYVRAHLQWLLRACEAGVNVGGYFIWSLMDMFSWTNGYQKRYGLFHVDFDTQRRTPKASAYWFAQVARTGRLL